MEKVVIVDANAYIALNWKKDPNHSKATVIFNQLKKDYLLFTTNNYLVSEVATVLLLRLKNPSKVSAIINVFYNPPKNLKMTQINKTFQLQSLNIFSSQEKPRLSLPDCTLISQALEQKITTIFTFDQNLKKSPLLKKGFKFIP